METTMKVINLDEIRPNLYESNIESYGQGGCIICGRPLSGIDMEQLKFLPKLRLKEAQLQKILKDRDYETLDVSNGECASDGITYKIDGRVVEIIDE